ncbi:Uncharacterised protein [Corynebacterium pilosum]|uniref:Uncharacterized protein n=1 Tax=Corynebacterium pilosum TaxID=35756 RepID=A0A376CN90_9CORY|nr:Uncharacterised protein [Corynebacterium pilosum]
MSWGFSFAQVRGHCFLFKGGAGAVQPRQPRQPRQPDGKLLDLKCWNRGREAVFGGFFALNQQFSFDILARLGPETVTSVGPPATTCAKTGEEQHSAFFMQTYSRLV